MGTCSSSNDNNNIVSDIDDIRNAKEDVQNTNVYLNSNLEKEKPVLKLLDGHYNLIFGPDPNSKMIKVDGDKLSMIGNNEEPEAITPEYGKVENCRIANKF